MSGQRPSLRTIAGDLGLSVHALSSSSNRNALSGGHGGSDTLGSGLASAGYHSGKHGGWLFGEVKINRFRFAGAGF